MEGFKDVQLIASKSEPRTKVSKATYELLNEEVCIKEQLFEKLEDANAAVREAVHQLRIHHPAVVGIKAQFLEQVEEEWKAVIVMELMSTDLEQELKRRRRKKQSWSEEELMNMLKTLVGALALAQQMNIAHRDISLNNLLLSSSGAVKLSDFGMSKWDEGTDQHTCTGTLAYFSPLLRQSMATALTSSINSHNIRVAHNVYKSDVYSLGVCFLSLASIKLPKDMRGDGNPAEVLLQEVQNLQGYNELKQHLQTMLTPEELSRPDFTQLSQLLDAVLESSSTTDTANPFDILSRPTIVIEEDGMGGVRGEHPSSLSIMPQMPDTPCEFCNSPIQEGGERRGRHSQCFFNKPVSPASAPLKDTCQQCQGKWVRGRLLLPCGHGYCSLPCLLTYVSARTSYFRLRPILMCQLCSTPFGYLRVYEWVGGSMAYHRLSLQVQRTCVNCGSRNSQFRLGLSNQYVCFDCLDHVKTTLHDCTSCRR
jgi:serine/threonine protein kinase